MFRRRNRDELPPPEPLGDEPAFDSEADLEPVPEVAGVAEDPEPVDEPAEPAGDAYTTAPIPVTGNGQALLTVDGLTSGYGSLPVLHGISFEVEQGETAVLLGLNGAGKTTTALNLCGAVRPWSGTIFFDGQDATRWNTPRAVDNGIVLVPEGRRVFPDLSVAKNLQVGAWSQRRASGWMEEQRERVYDYFPRLRERETQLAGTLSGGEQQMLAIGRGLMANPRLLIIDEASLGLAPVIVQDVFHIVRQINEDGVTVIMIEQNIGALSVADVGLVMEQGTIIAEVRGEELEDPSRLREIFLG